MTPITEKIAQFKRTLAWFDNEELMQPDYKAMCHDAVKIMKRGQSANKELLESLKELYYNFPTNKRGGMGLSLNKARTIIDKHK